MKQLMLGYSGFPVHIRTVPRNSIQGKIQETDFCFIFIFRFRLDLHLRTHDGRRPFQCPGCEYTCSRKDNLGTHVKKQHKMSLEECKANFGKGYDVELLPTVSEASDLEK